MDYCAPLARSIPIGQAIAMRYQAMEQLLAPSTSKYRAASTRVGITITDIGILGLDKAGGELSGDLGRAIRIGYRAGRKKKIR